MKALLVRLSSIGDVVHTLPSLAALRSHGMRAGWLVEPAARPLLQGHPLLDYVGSLPAARAFSLRQARATLGDVRRQRFDIALDFQGLWKSATWARLSGAPRVLGYAARARREPASAFLLNQTADMPETATHVIDKNLALLRPLGIEALGLREFPLPPTDAEARRVAEQLASVSPGPFAILNPGGGWASKQWPAASFGALAQALRGFGIASLVTFGPGEEALADRVVATSDGAARRSFPTTLLEYVELARRARLVVAADTGPLHLACAIGTPVVGLFGPTDPARNGPFAPADVVVRKTPACAPCHRRVCTSHAGVMAEIALDEVREAVRRRLASATSPASP